jgi:hypothetical protein
MSFLIAWEGKRQAASTKRNSNLAQMMLLLSFRCVNY